ncbi:MBL fold metallo-hydrolase [Pedobacter steynii]|uniref:Metallo-beta-lactamase domain-containing protein n=1 Tax=Pedobacter steynii TaxID=430522 RepID=A0A1D7QFJ3_9SPHI|nr:MBL fold metallo-hydrolase [Pedobacter steynii]AOM77424.1 hypothetical protein BFS30_09735 [Pedobacter steynii]
MKRRTFLKHSSLLGITAVIPFKNFFSDPAKKSFHRFSLGELELTIVTDGHIPLSPVQPFFAPMIDSATVATELKNNFRSVKEVDLSINVLVIRKKDKIILIDTGTGISEGNVSGWLPQSLADAGISPSQVTDIVISHAHPDHIGGLINKDGGLTFSNAQVYLSKIENEFWAASHPDFSKSKLSDQMISSVVSAAHKTISVIKDRLHLFNDKDVLFDCIRLQIAPGHTPGHTVCTVFSGEEELIDVADLVHSDVLVIPHPEWGFFGDTDFDLAIKTRRAVLEQIAVKKQRIFAYHLPWPGLGHVRKKGDAYELVPEVFVLPD